MNKREISILLQITHSQGAPDWYNPATVGSEVILNQLFSVYDIKSNKNVLAKELSSCEYLSLIDSCSVCRSTCRGCHEYFLPGSLIASYAAILSLTRNPTFIFSHALPSCIKQTLASSRTDSLIVERLRTFGIKHDKMFVSEDIFMKHRQSITDLISTHDFWIVIRTTSNIPLFRNKNTHNSQPSPNGAAQSGERRKPGRPKKALPPIITSSYFPTTSTTASSFFPPKKLSHHL